MALNPLNSRNLDQLALKGLKLASKLHNGCTQVILLLLGIRDVGTQVVFELFNYF